jgi:Family of unknown function (DUF6064)
VHLPFTAAEFLALFRDYNRAVWPVQGLLLALGLGASVAAFRHLPDSRRIVTLCLALLWAWTGVGYHFVFFRAINPLATLFGIICLLQAALFLVYAGDRGALTFGATRSLPGLLGGLLLAYAFVVYPLLSRAFGHPYPASPTFGTPCPTTIATIGLLLWARPRVPVRLAVVPIAWAGIGTLAALQLGIYEDLGLTVAGLIATALVLQRRSSAPPSMPA